MEGFKVAVEFRPRIRSCHFFIKSIDEPKSVEIKDKNLILVKFKKESVIRICVNDLSIISNSLSGLQITQNSMYFQARTNPEITNGSFHCELLTNDQPMDKDSSMEYTPNIITGQPANFQCRNCSADLIVDISFDRLLPLPSSDGSDFFCHGPNCIDLNPKARDCLYNNFYFKINPTDFSSAAKFRSCLGIIYCPDCQSWLGIQEESSVTLWNSTIKLKNDEPEDSSPSSSEQARQDFIYLVKAISKKELGVTSRIIFNLRINNEEIHYLLLWIMDKNLTLFIDNQTVNEKLMLRETKVAKVLYAHEKSSTDIVQQWKDDIRVNEEQISKQMMEEGLILLEEMSNIIPDPFRKTNQLNVSYIK